MRTRRLATAETVKLLAHRLSQCSEVTRFDLGQNREAWTIAHAFADLEESFTRFLDEQLPQLVEQPLNEKDMNELLMEIGEEFRHVLYHINDPAFYRYLSDRDTGQTNSG